MQDWMPLCSFFWNGYVSSLLDDYDKKLIHNHGIQTYVLMILLMVQAWNQFQQDQVLDIVDSSLEGQYPREQVLRVIRIALLCTQGSWALRPAMSEVVSMLTNNSEITVQPTQPAFIDDSAGTPSDSVNLRSASSHGSITVSLVPR